MTTGFILVFTIFGLTSIYLSGLQNETMEKQIASTQAFWLAEAGIQKAYNKLNFGDEDNWSASEWDVFGSGYESKDPLAINENGWCEIQITSVGSNMPVITAYGYVPIIDQEITPDKDAENYAKRIIELGLYKNSFYFALVGKDEVVMGGNARTDSYNSSTGTTGDNGDVATNGDITMNGDEAFINGDADTGPEGTFAETDQVSGEITHESNIPLPPVIVPQELIDLPSSGQLTAPPAQPLTGLHKYTSIKLANPTDQLVVQGPASIYLTGSSSLSITGPAAFIISESSTGPVYIYADGDVSISGQGIVNTTQTPSNFLLYSTASAEDSLSKPPQITFSGQTDLYGAIYAPGADVSITGLSYDIYGAIIGKTLDISGNGTVHYDEALSDVIYGQEKYSLLAWKEIY